MLAVLINENMHMLSVHITDEINFCKSRITRVYCSFPFHIIFPYFEESNTFHRRSSFPEADNRCFPSGENFKLVTAP